MFLMSFFLWLQFLGPQLPVTHVDIKVPSEHWMEGKQYLAEYQIFLIQNRDKQRGAPAVSVLFDFHPQDEKNKRFQILLDAFQDVYDRDMAQCRAKRRRQRRLGALLGKRGKSDDDDLDANRSTWLDEPWDAEDRFQRALREAERRTQDIRKFNPWTSDIVRTLYFFGYEGSLTEPPCTEVGLVWASSVDIFVFLSCVQILILFISFSCSLLNGEYWTHQHSSAANSTGN